MPHHATPEPDPLPLVVDLHRIANRARQHGSADTRYREWLKERSPLSNDQLDRLVEHIRADVEPRIDCVACNHCCRTLQVVVDRKDIARLARRLDVQAEHFADEYVDTAPDGVQHLRRRPCPFLGQDGACTVYEDRPRACRDYPYLDTPRIRARSLTVLENVPHCPIVFNVWERLKAEHPAPDPVPTPDRASQAAIRPPRKPRRSPRP